MADLMKRVHYFDHQFLQVEDFTCEQDYHMARRRLHNRVLHTPGIAQGLEVDYKPGAKEVTIRPGTAVDSEGREIVLTEDRNQPLPDWKESQEYRLTIAYDEKPTNPTEETGVKGYTRLMEKPVIEWLKDPGQKVVLAQVRRSDDKVTLDSSEKVRTVAGAKLGETTVRKLTLTRDDVDSSQWPALSCGAAKRIDLSGSLSVSGPLYAPSSLRIVSDKTENWENLTSSAEWVQLLERKITLSAPTHLLVLGHGHGIAEDHARLDLVIVIDGDDPPMGDEGLRYGMGVAHATDWMPIIAVTASLLDKGEHTIELKYREGTGAREPLVRCCGVSMHTMFLGSAL